MYGEKLRIIRNFYKLTQTKMAEILKTTPRNYAAYERNENNPPYFMLDVLCKTYNINLNWFVSDKGDMFISTCENTLESRNNETLTTNIDTFHKRLQKLMQENDLNTWDLAKKTGIRESHISSLIVADKRPSLDDLHALKTHFDVSIDWLLYGETPNPTGKESSTQESKSELSAAEIEFLRNLMKKSSS